MEKELRILEVKNGKLVKDKSMGAYEKKDDQLLVGLPKKEEPEEVIVEETQEVDEVEEDFDTVDYNVDTVRTRHQHDEMGTVLIRFNLDNEENVINVFGYKIEDFQEGFSKKSPLFTIELNDEQRNLPLEEFNALITEYVVDYAKAHYID